MSQIESKVSQIESKESQIESIVTLFFPSLNPREKLATKIQTRNPFCFFFFPLTGGGRGPRGIRQVAKFQRSGQERGTGTREVGLQGSCGVGSAWSFWRQPLLVQPPTTSTPKPLQIAPLPINIPTPTYSPNHLPADFYAFHQHAPTKIKVDRCRRASASQDKVTCHICID